MKARNRLFRLAAAATFLLVAAAGPMHAAAPNLLTYQGRLKEVGLPVTGTRSVDISLCDSLIAGSCTNTGAQSVAVVNGLFRTTFTVPAGVALESGAWYIQVQVGAAIFTPRELLTASPYAVYASSAGTLAAVPGAASVQISTVVSIAAQNAAGYSLVLSSGVTAPLGTITAKYFAGSGAYLTGITSIDNTKVVKTGDSMTGQLNMIGVAVNLTGPGGVVVGVSSITAASFFGDGSHLSNVVATGGVLKTGDTMTGQLTMLSTITVQGNAFSVGGSTFVVASGSVAIGTASPQAKLHVQGDEPQLRLQAATANQNVLINLRDSSNSGLGGLGYSSAANGVMVFGGSGRPLLLAANDTEQARVTAAGSVGIGTAAPSARLHISSGAGWAGDVVVVSTGLSTLLRVTGQGEVYAGKFFGDGSSLTGVNAANLPAAGVTAGTLISGVLLNAGSLTNGPVASGILPSTVAYKIGRAHV